MSDTYGYVGFQEVETMADDHSALSFLIQQILGKQGTVALVQVMSDPAPNGVSVVGFVDIQPMVHQTDGIGQTTPHGIIANAPYLRIQGGANAVICDPRRGDIGLALICSRDTTTAKNSRKPSPPGSFRRHDLSDAVFLGGVRNGQPTQYIYFADDGVHVVSPNALIIQAPNVTLDASGNLIVKGEVTRGGLGGAAPLVHLGTHHHTNSGGTGDGGPPRDGT